MNYTISGTWKWKDDVQDYWTGESHEVSFTSNGSQFSRIVRDSGWAIFYDNTFVYSGMWDDESIGFDGSYQTIDFGTEPQAVDEAFYTWFTANAIQTTIADKLIEIAENELKVFEAGKQAEYDTFWDAFQENGERASYTYGFTGRGWTPENFKPKYSMQPARVDYMFAQASQIKIDLVEHFESLGITLDTSASTIMQCMFLYCYATRVGVIDCTSCTGLTQLFSNSRLITIDKLILKADGSNTFSETFQNQTYLKNITIEGVIGQNFNIKNAPLTLESAKNIITHLKNYAGTASDGKVTVYFSADVWSLLNADSGEPSTGLSWAEYVQSIGWNI